MKLKVTSLGQYSAPRRLAIFVLILLLLWLPLAAPIYWLVGDPDWRSILTMAILYIEFIVLVGFWAQLVYDQPQIIRSYGLEFTGKNCQNHLAGLVYGLLTVITLLVVEGWFGWLGWQAPQPGLTKIVLEGMAIALAVGFAEELLFRGWLLDELQRDYSPRAALWANATIFATLHYIKPPEYLLAHLPEFPGLLLLGLTLVLAKQYGQGRLGLPMGFHAGLVWGYYIVNTGQLLQYSGTVPTWITGINGNPLAGVMGMLWMAVIAISVRLVQAG